MRLFFLVFFLPFILFSQPKPPGYETLKTFGKSGPNEYGCIITTPIGYKNSLNTVPLFIFLHGNSRKGDDLNLVMNQYGSVYEQKKGFKIPGIVLAPQCYEGSWSYELIDSLLEWTKKNYRIDTTRIYLLGMSMGGSGTWICGSRLNYKFAALAPMCGGSYIQYGWTNPCALIKMPIWTFHGENDEPVPIEETYSTVDAIKSCSGGDSLKVTYLPEKGHDLTFLFRDPKVYNWLLSHRKTDFKNYWIEEKKEEIKNTETEEQANENQNYFTEQKTNNTEVYNSIPKNNEKISLTSTRLSTKWKPGQLSNAQPNNTNTMTLDEIEVIKIINLARLYPKQFLQFEILDNSTLFNFDSYYVKSLVTELNNRSAVEKLDGSKKMKSLAECFVKEQGPTGEIGHQRTFCSKGYFGECCSYGPKNPLEIVLLLLVDEDVPSLGHREACLSSYYQSIGVSIGTHETSVQMSSRQLRQESIYG